MYNLKLILIIILMLSISRMTNAYIKFFTSSYPNVGGEALKSEIWIDKGNEFLLKNSNSYNLNGESGLQGVGVVVGSNNEIDNYNEIKNKILMLNRKNSEIFKKYLKHKKLNVLFENKGLMESSYILYDSQDEEQKKIVNWFNERRRNILENNKYKLQTGFIVSSNLVFVNNCYNLELLIKNVSNEDIVISGLSEWNNQKDKISQSPNVRIIFGEDLNIFSTYLDESNVISLNEDDLAGILIKANESKKINFKLDNYQSDELDNFFKSLSNGIVGYSVVMNLSVKSPSLISGRFKYNTIGNKFYLK